MTESVLLGEVEYFIEAQSRGRLVKPEHVELDKHPVSRSNVRPQTYLGVFLSIIWAGTPSDWRSCPSHTAALLAASKALHVSETAFLSGTPHLPAEMDVRALLTSEIQLMQEWKYCFMRAIREVSGSTCRVQQVCIGSFLCVCYGNLAEGLF